MKLGYNKNMAILDENEFTEAEGRSYLNPQIALDESNAFIDNLRSTQQSDNQKIQMDTYNLGTDISSNLGGLTSPVTNDNGGAGLSYFTSRYQTPQTESAVANLRSAAQAQALNQVLANEQEKWKKRYNDAYRAYQKRQNNPQTDGGDVEYEDTGEYTNLDAVQDMNQYGTTSTIYDSTEQALDSRSTERNKQIEVIKDSNGNVSTLIINGTPVYGREARARYRYLKNAGLVR